MRAKQSKNYKEILIIIVTVLLLFTLFERLTLPETNETMILQASIFLEENNKPTPSKHFTQDGCSLFFDSLPGHNFNEACLRHDIKYWAGGTKEERKLADIALKNDIAHTGFLGPVLAPIVYSGVRIFGDSFITKIVNAHWGYGWDS